MIQHVCVNYIKKKIMSLSSCRNLFSVSISYSEKRQNSSSTPATPAPTPVKSSANSTGALSYTGAIVGARSHTFAAKLTATPPLDTKPRATSQVFTPSFKNNP